MNKLDKYIISNYIKSFILGMMMFYLIFLLAESISLTGWLMDGKLKGHDAIKYLRYGTPEIITNTAPLGVLLGSLLCISKMAKQLEIAAMKTSGISFARITLFPVFFSFLVSTGVFWLNYDMLGKSNLKISIYSIVPVFLFTFSLYKTVLLSIFTKTNFFCALTGSLLSILRDFKFSFLVFDFPNMS